MRRASDRPSRAAAIVYIGCSGASEDAIPDLEERLQGILGQGYRIERELGGGGMSRVFLAHDVALDRKVVIKVLPPELAAGLSSERFKREIQLAARLQHPHIVPVLTTGAADGLLYYAMPFIAGESLRARLAHQHELPVNEVVRILRDVVDALAHAHGEGVVHRDIKPDNILLAGHHALVTDFGVSKAVSRAGDSDLTSAGIALGTPAYMSPEQASADPDIDHRSDIYSIGAVGYEVLTGQPPFSGMPPQQILAAHLSRAPEHVSSQRVTVPPALAAIIMRCLEKRPADRWQNAEELLSQLEALATPSGGMEPTRGVVVQGRRFDWRFAVGAGAVAASLAGLWWVNRPAPMHVIGSTQQVTNAPGLELDAAISPDAQLVAYAAGPPGRTRIYVRQVAGGSPRVLTDAALGGARTPRWSADGQSLTFLVGQSLYSVMALGGTPRLLMEGKAYEFASPALSPDGSTIAFADDSAIYAQPVSGGAARKLAAVQYPSYLVWASDGGRLAFVSDNAWFIYGLANLGNLAPSFISIVGTNGGEAPIRITEAAHLNTSPVWGPDGRSLLFVSNMGGSRDIYEQRLTRKGRPRGAPVRLTTGSNAHTISLSANGSRLAYSALTTRSNLWTAPISSRRATLFTEARAVTDENQIVEGMGVSRDGEWLVYDSNRNGSQHIFRVRTSGGEPEQLTRDSADSFLPAWSPDGRWIAYHSWRSGNRDVYVMAADGRETGLATGYPGHEMNPVWSADGRELLFISDRSGRWELHAISRTQDGWSTPRQVTRDFGYNGRWSPDGKRIAYVSLVDTTLHAVNADGSGSRLLFDGHGLGLTTQQVAFGDRSDVVYFHAVDRESRHVIYEQPLSGGPPRLVMRFPDPARQPRRFEFDTDGRRLFFTLATDESDVWLMELKIGSR